MKKRTFLKALLAGSGVALSARPQMPRAMRNASPAPGPALPLQAVSLEQAPPEAPEKVPTLVETTLREELALERLQQNELHPHYVHQEHRQDTETLVEQLPEDRVDDYLRKIRNFDADFHTDIYLSAEQALLLKPVVERLERVQAFVGHANFNLLGFDEMRYFARNYDAIGAFEPAELAFLDEVFHADAGRYGFFGDKVTPGLTHRILQKDVKKIAGSGHYLRRGESLTHYEQIRRDVGHDLLLTSGLRNVVKQMHLFLAKALHSDGNLSKASRSLAPPGYSYHNLGDFDVGKIGLGELNFTSDFSNTAEFKRLITLGYVDIRYTDSNRFGVRYEPWHIKLG